MSSLYQSLTSTIWLAGALFCASAHALTVTADTENRAYPVPDHGELILDVPIRWEVTYVSQGETRPPLITFFMRDEAKQEIFQLNISILWDDGFKRDITSPEHIRDIVEQSGSELLQQSSETELELQPIEGTSGSGYYFMLSDAAPKPGEYAFLTQGALSVGNLVIIFSLFTRERDSIEVQQSLHMLRHAVQRFQPHV